jgi:hypothetical protein
MHNLTLHDYVGKVVSGIAFLYYKQDRFSELVSIIIRENNRASYLSCSSTAGIKVEEKQERMYPLEIGRGSLELQEAYCTLLPDTIKAVHDVSISEENIGLYLEFFRMNFCVLNIGDKLTVLDGRPAKISGENAVYSR